MEKNNSITNIAFGIFTAYIMIQFWPITIIILLLGLMFPGK